MIFLCITLASFLAIAIIFSIRIFRHDQKTIDKLEADLVVANYRIEMLSVSIDVGELARKLFVAQFKHHRNSTEYVSDAIECYTAAKQFVSIGR